MRHPGIESAVRVDDDNHGGRMGFQHLDAALERIAFASALEIVSFEDLGAAFPRDASRCIGTVVGNDQQPVAFRQLLTESIQGSPESRALRYEPAQARRATAVKFERLIVP